MINYHLIQILLQQQQLTPMRLDPSYLHFITKQEMRILVAIQIGMRNHEYVPLSLIASIGNIRSGETFKIIRKLLKNKFVVHVGGKREGYKLTYLGYDYLALKVFIKRGVIKDVICKIGVGKESDIYKCEAPDGTPVVLKLTRLGRRSFRTIKRNRQYIQNRTNYNWLYLSRLSSMREFLFMQILNEDGFPTPKPIDTNRHAIVMSLIEADPLCHIRRIGQQCSVKEIFENCLDLVQKFASRGLIHGDFNEFNLMINQEGQLTVIDFPQCISTNHVNADEYFNRDVECLYRYFEKMLMKCNKQEDGEIFIHPNDKGFDVSNIPMPVLSQIPVIKRLDKQVTNRGHIKLSEQKQLEEYQRENFQFQEKRDLEEQESQESQESQIQKQAGQEQEERYKEINEELELEQQEIKRAYKNSCDQDDNEIKELMGELKEFQLEVNQSGLEDGGQSEEVQGECETNQQKGLTAFQIRQKIKEEKRLQRLKKKEEMTAEEYIKKALTKQGKKRGIAPKGNYGSKKKAKDKAQSIKDGLEMGW